MEKIEIIKPDDWHVHFRDNEILKTVVPETSKNFARSIVMPNLTPPILNVKQAIDYKKRIEKVIPPIDNFKPYMTIYLTEETNKSELKQAYKDGAVFAVKLYPAGATTNSESGVRNIKEIMSVLETMAEIGMPLLIHGEVTDRDVDIFDREKNFIDHHLDFICKEIPDLKITLEHITTKDAVQYIDNGNENLGASITPHHLCLNRNDMLVGGIRPHYYCLPVLKRESHREELLKVAVSGNLKFFLGTDTAPHLNFDKENSCGCAGIFNATYCLQILTQIFDNESSLDNLEKFVSINGATHYELENNTEKITLVKSKKPILFQKKIVCGNDYIEIFNPNFPVFWDVKR